MKYLCFAGMMYQLFLVISGATIQYPLSYQLGIAIFWLIGFLCYYSMQKQYLSPTDTYVNKIVSHTKRIYDECNFMYCVNRNAINNMKTLIIKTNDRAKLEILERKYHLLEAQDKLLDSQLKLNKEVDDGMHKLTDVEKELANYDCADK